MFFGADLLFGFCFGFEFCLKKIRFYFGQSPPGFNTHINKSMENRTLRTPGFSLIKYKKKAFSLVHLEVRCLDLIITVPEYKPIYWFG